MTMADAMTNAPGLESLLRGLLAEHEQLLASAGEHMDAARAADVEALRVCVEKRTVILQRISDLEEDRRRLVNTIGVGIPVAGRRGPLTLTEIASAMPDPHRTKLLDIAQRLRGVMERVQTEHGTLRAVLGALAAHTEGVIRQVAGRLSASGAYGRRGTVDSTPVATAIDLRS
jgi:hypothetical protein